MEAIYFGNTKVWYYGIAPGPWIMADQENDLVGCVNPGSTPTLRRTCRASPTAS